MKEKAIRNLTTLSLFLSFSCTNAVGYDSLKFPGRGSIQAWRNAGDFNNAGASLLTQGKYQEALTYFDKAVLIYPYDGAIFLNRGLCFAKQNLLEKAIDEYKKCIALNAVCDEAYYCMGNSFWKLRKYSNAEAAYKTAIHLNATFVDPRINLAEVYLETNRPQEAHHLLLSAAKLPKGRLPENKSMIDEDLRKAQAAIRESKSKSRNGHG